MSGRTTGWRRALLILVALAGMATTFSLGRWQLSRAAEKQALQAEIVARRQQPVLDGTTLAGTLAPAEADALLHRVISLHGHWLADRTIYLDNRVMDRHAGFYVLTPLRLAGRDTVVLVQRGWAPRNFADRQALPPVATPAGEVRVDGYLAAHASRAYALGAEGHGPIRQNLDLDAFRSETGLPLAGLLVWQTGASSDGLRRDWPEASAGVATHHGYAFQWFGLCALIAVLLIWFQIVRPVLHSSRA